MSSTLALSATRHGAWIERIRKPLSAAFFVCWLLLALFTRPPGGEVWWREALEFAGFFLLIAAALGRVWAFAYIGGRKNRELCQSGPYALSRNPLYFFSFLGAAGACLALQSLALLAITVPAFLLYYDAVMAAEERRLDALFGADFVRYRAFVPRFWPRLARPERQGSIQLDVGLFTRGLSEVFWFLAFIVAAELIEWCHAHQLWTLWAQPF